MGVADGVADGSVAVGDAAPDTCGLGPDVAGDGDGLVGDGVGEWPVCRGVGVGLGDRAGVAVGAGLVGWTESAAADGEGGRT